VNKDELCPHHGWHSCTFEALRRAFTSSKAKRILMLGIDHAPCNERDATRRLSVVRG